MGRHRIGLIHIEIGSAATGDDHCGSAVPAPTTIAAVTAISADIATLARINTTTGTAIGAGIRTGIGRSMGIIDVHIHIDRATAPAAIGR